MDLELTGGVFKTTKLLFPRSGMNFQAQYYTPSITVKASVFKISILIVSTASVACGFFSTQPNKTR